MKNIYDVAVIGAGPAGAVFAAELASADPARKILLIDGIGEGKGKMCGGLLAPDAQKVLAKLHLTLPNSTLADPQIFAVETVDLAPRYVRHYTRHYLNMNRAAFDAWLLSRVPDSVTVMRGRCFSVAEEGGEYHLRIRCADGIREEFAASVVGADGSYSLVRRRFFEDSMFRYVSVQEWYEGDVEQIPPYACVFDAKTSDSCSWTIRKDGLALFGGAFRREGCSEAFEEQKSRLEEHLGQAFGDPVRREGCFVSSPRKWRDFIPGRAGVYLCGEAAGFISASSFEGISSAILSGKLLAESFLGGRNAEEILRMYRRKTFGLRLKLWCKIPKMRILCSPILRSLIMRSGIQSVKRYR